MDTILILDDDAANLQGIGAVLRSEGYSVLEVYTGLQAIETGRICGPISLFVTDMDLPHSAGTEIALKLVALYPTLPVLFISGTPRVWWTHRDVSNFMRFPPTSVDSRSRFLYPSCSSRFVSFRQVCVTAFDRELT